MISTGMFLRNRYRILRLLGRGGMADVYLAQDERRQVQVAIKVLREDLAEDPDFLRRFAREARALAQLDHPNIVRFYSFEQDGLVAFMVMDYVDGVTLRRLLAERQGPLRLEEVTSILQQVGAALHYAHGKGIIHRDLKPGNIMLQRDGKVLLTDFGIAKLMESATMTAAGIGTPAYMSPEQILNQGVDQRTDIYSLGVMAYQMATGRRPFTGEERGLTESGTGSRMREAHLRLAPPQPTTLNPALPVEAGHVIMRALAKRPEDRWPDVMSMVRAWERAVGVQSRAPVVTLGRENLSPTPTPPTGPPISPASPSPVLSEPTPPSTGGKRIWPVLAGVGVVVVAALLGLWLLLPRASDEPPVAGAPVPPPTSSPMVQTTPLPTAMKVEAPTTDVAGTAQALAATYAAATAEVKETMAAEAEVRARATMTAVATTATSQAQSTESVELPVEVTETPPPSSPVPLSPVIGVTAPMVNLRLGPGTNYPRVGRVLKGQIFTVIARDHSGSWAQISINGKDAWIINDARWTSLSGDLDSIPVAKAIPPPPTPPPSPKFHFVSIKGLANSKLTDGYVNPPLGRVNLGGIPFDLGQGESIVTQAAPIPHHPEQLRFDVDISNPEAAYFLMTGGNLFSRFDGQPLGKIRFMFAGGQVYEVPLIAGKNIREWKHYQNNVVVSTTDPNVVEVWRGNNKFDTGIAVLDMQNINLPVSLHTQRLVAIEIWDETQYTVHDMDPALNLDGITIEYR